MSPRHRRSTSLIALVAAGLLLAGCSGSSDSGSPDSADTGSGESASPSPESNEADSASASSDPAAADPDSQGRATLRAQDREFVFALDVCLVSDDELLIGGPGVESATGTVARLDGAALSDGAHGWIGEFRADVGTDERFESMDDFVAVSNGGDRLSHATDGQQFDFAGSSWDASGGERGHGEISFTCS